MKAIRVHAHGGPEVLCLEDLPEPEPGPGEVERAQAILDWIREGTLRLRIWREFPLAEAAEAHRALEARATVGKLLLIPG